MKKIVNNILNILIPIIYVVVMVMFGYYLFKLNIIPEKYLIIGGSVFGLINILIIFLSIKKHHLISNIIMLIISILLVFVTLYLFNTYHFINGIQVSESKITYKVVVLKDSSYQKINDLSNKKIGYVKDSTSDIEGYLTKVIKYEDYIDEFTNLQDMLYKEELDALTLEDSYLNLIYEEDEEFKNKTKEIYSFNVVEKKVVEEENKNIDINKDAFVLYISGIDQYGNVNSVRGRSDVNILAVVNPKTNKILLVNTPRDYYVQLDGTVGGLKDKLTHAGIYGIEKSMKTLENLYTIQIDYYLRVNFDTLVKVVDTIDGIDVYSDKAFTPWTNRDVYINEGWNHFDGAAALAYSRERKTYLTGDNHRGQNQQQVITAIINKVSKSSVLISKYNSILRTLDGSFQSSMPMDLITDFIKYQIANMPSWDIESIHVTGYDRSDYTYSAPTHKAYVMEPNMNSVNKAITQIKEVLEEN